jgi:hypothetical protein
MSASPDPTTRIHERESTGRSLFSPPTSWLAFVGATIFASGFFVLAAAGNGYSLDVLALILGGAAILTLPVLVLALVVAGSESLVGRAWASGFYGLAGTERGGRGTGARALRYAGFLWLANGGALWFATLASRM